jgi:L-2-hydroxyglutarate oxidase LhgO
VSGAAPAIDVDYAIIGAGVVGLALAEALTRRQPTASVLLIERHRRPGQETSSRNSEVIHAGLYYWNTPRKGETCRRGRDLLYDFCEQHSIEHRRCGKYIVALQDAQLPELARIADYARSVGVPVEEVAAPRLRTQLQHPGILAGLWSPSTGIVDSHSLMKRIEAAAEARGAILSYGTSFLAPESVSADHCSFTARDGNGELCRVRARRLYNSAGLSAARIAAAFAPQAGFAIRPCRGRYFALASRFTGAYGSLLYPLPDPAGGLGVHLTLDLSGRCRLGPDVDWSMADRDTDDPTLYAFGDEKDQLQQRFLVAGQRLLPTLRGDDLSPDYVGVRPKLFIGEQAHPDFAIQAAPTDSVWHLLGIESPGLTAALAIAEDLSQLRL